MIVRLLTWNILSGGGKRVPELSDAISKHNPDIAVIAEFRHGLTGKQLQSNLSDLGLTHQVCTEALPGKNTVLIASRLDKFDAGIDIPAELQDYVVATRLGDTTIIGTFCATPIAGNDFLQFLSKCRDRNFGSLTLATGDFFFGPQGSNPGNYSKLSPILNAGWVDVFKRDNQKENVWCCRSSSGGVSRPDHIFATPDLAKRINKVSYSQSELDAKMSDHAPLLAEVDICF